MVLGVLSQRPASQETMGLMGLSRSAKESSTVQRWQDKKRDPTLALVSRVQLTSEAQWWRAQFAVGEPFNRAGSSEP